jgi:hypothetical protein
MTERRLSTGARRLAWLACTFACWALGCAAALPFRQDFVEVVTPNFHVTSSLGEAMTRALVRDLELFHAGVLHAVGLEAELAPRTRTRVVAFDGRGMSRPFAVRGASASLLPSIEGATLMIRAPGRFEERVDPELRHRYAHRVLRDHSRELPPLWYEEGRAQLASTIAIRAGEVEIGRVAAAHRARVLDWRRSDLAEILRVRQVARLSEADRALFESQSWALVHTLLLADASRRPGRSDLDRIRAAYRESADWARVSVVELLGTDDEALTARVYGHLEGKKFRATRLRVETFDADALSLRPVPPSVANRRLAELALELMRWELADDYFGRVLREQPGDPLGLAGSALARARQGNFETLDDLAARARRSDASTNDGRAPSSAAGRERAKRELWLGWAYLSQAAGAGSESVAAAAREAAEQAFRASLERSDESAEGAAAWLGLAMTGLDRGEDADEVYRRLDQARRLQPGALRIRLAAARIAAKLGRETAAEAEAAQVISRSHWRDLIEAAEPFIRDR